MTIIYKGFLTLAGAVLLAGAFPALAQNTAPPIYNPTGTSGSTYDFNARRNTPAEDPVAAERRHFEQLQARYSAVALEQQKQHEARMQHIRQEIAASSQPLQPARTQPRQGGDARATGSSGEVKKKMVYKPPEEKKDEPGRLFNLKWR